MVNSSFNVMQFYLWLTYQRNITFMKYILLKINIWDRIGTYFFLLFYFGWEKIQKWTQRFWGSLQNAVRLCFLNTRSKSSLVVGLKGIKSEVFFSLKTFWFFSTYLILNLYFLTMFIPTLYLSENSGPSLLTSPVSRMIPFGRKPNNVWSRLIDEKIISSIRYNNKSKQ